VPPLHIASSLAKVGMLGSTLILGLMAGLIALDIASWIRGDGFSGQSLVGAALLASMALAPGLACWVAGRRMMRSRDEPPSDAPRRLWGAAVFLFFLGVTLGWVLGLPAA
jgi:hypothetical protein